MHDLSRHPYFQPWVDPASGITSYVLRERVAPVQQSFYFTNPCVSPDENWLWFYVAFPPNRQRMLAVVSLDPAKPLIKLFPQAGFTSASPMVARESTPATTAVYFCMANSVYRMDLDGSTQIVCTVPEDYIGRRNYGRTATHLTMSADGKYFLLDGDLGNFWWVGVGDIETGEVEILKEFGSHHNHAQFSPTDPRLFLIPEDWWLDKISGRRFSYDHRLWLMDIDQTRYEVVRPKAWDSGHAAAASHEWWSRDGMVCWNDYETGTHECDPYTLEVTHVWKRALCHAHCSADRNLWCADESPYKWGRKPLEILFYDRRRDRDVQIVSDMPQPALGRNSYHLDPHPQFSPRDSWVVYTTTVRGEVDVALTPVQPVVDASE
jgi:Tol biopolymer transport system component